MRSIKTAYEYIKIALRRLRKVRLNRNTLRFLVFLVISIGFWFMQTGKETATLSQDYKLKLVGVPKNVIFTSEVPEKIKVNITGRGFTIFSYTTKNDNHVITVHYDELEHTSSRIIIDNATIRRALTKKLGNTLKVNTISPAQIDAYYTNGLPKKVPVISRLKVTTGPNYTLTSIKPLKDSVWVYAPVDVIDSIKAVYTEVKKIENIEETTTTKLALKKTDKVKIIPDSVNVKANVSLFLEMIVPVKIYSINTPNNKFLRTFPDRANVVCRVSADLFNDISENDFIIAVDFNKIKPGAKSCKVELLEKPEGVSKMKISPSNVEFVVEQTAQ